jgi:glycosyltransferase involved in cell wall biosynthesis
LRGLVVFGEDWGGHPSSTQHLITRLAHGRDVIWINSIGLRRPRLTHSDVNRAALKVVKSFGPHANSNSLRSALPPRMSVIDPRSISWPGSRLASLVNRLLLGHQIRAACKRRQMSRPILWASLPSAVPVVGELGESAIVYYCGDDFGALPGVDHGPVRAMERKLAEHADLILVASKELASRFPRAKTAFVPHGVDFELFSRPVQRAQDLPFGKPIAGFYGSLAEWVDVELLVNAARILHDWNFVLIGPVLTDVNAFSRLPNIHLLGPRAHSILPAYAQHWDVALLPFRDTSQIRACNPLKLREYLAAGAPIAATDFPALAPYRDHVVIAENAASFPEAIRRAAASKASAPARRSRVAGESWEARAAAVSKLLESL